MTLRTELQKLNSLNKLILVFGDEYKPIGFNLLKDVPEFKEDLSNEVFSFAEADYILFSFESPNTDEVFYLNQVVDVENNSFVAETVDGDLVTFI